MTNLTPRQRLRQVLASDTVTSTASVFDPFSVRSAELIGYEIGMFGGSVAAMVVLGAPDIALLTLSELVEQTRRITRAAPRFPVLVDADHGYGNALNVRRTITELEHAGAAGVTIEDTLLPAAFGTHSEGLIGLEEGIGKIEAALDARQDPDFVVVGRTAAARISGIDDAINRAQSYERAGADAIFLQGIRTGEDIDKISSSLRGPIILGGVTRELTDDVLFAARNIRIVVRGHQPFAAAVEALHERQWAERGTNNLADPLRGEELLRRLRGEGRQPTP